MLDKYFNHQSVEHLLYDVWEKSDLFACRPESQKPPYTLMMPPPNVTGTLHVGHALTYTLQDILIRFKRMCGYDVLWQPGTDHAGIATQIVVERQLETQGITRQELGRDEFIKKIWEWKTYSGETIVNQQRRLGITPDWSRQRFTLDEGLSQAVRKAFVDLYNQGLIYRDKRLVNWDSKLQTALSDLEVISQEMKGSLWFIAYPLVENEEESIIIATTRPETLFGDMAIAVHPEDARYQHLIGKKVRIPLTNREIPIIADDYCDPEKGSGAVKITPAHDFNDFDVSKRHHLSSFSIMDKKGCLNENVPLAYQGMTIETARQQILNDLDFKKHLIQTESIIHMQPFSERSGVLIQPLLTDQWFLDAPSLAPAAIEAVEKGKTTFVPEHWNNTYFQWLRNIQPWCLSRQIWWGHQIPAWFGPDAHVFVAHTQEEAESQAERHYGCQTPLTQETDVLDTWFSSALWPFSTLGWPEDTKELNRYYPTNVLNTGFDIIFFWVARMMMMGIHFLKDVPFKTVYIHALVRDEKGAKMSKSKGNSLDPLVLINEYGCDALRYTLTSLSVPGRDLKLGESRIQGSRHFMTKLWNAARFLQIKGCVLDQKNFDPFQATLSMNRWIVSEVVVLARTVYKAFEVYRFDEAAQALYTFLWGTYCDFYLEFLKPTLDPSVHRATVEESQRTAAWVFKEFLKIANPIIPFITETLWKEGGEETLLLSESWPHYGREDLKKNGHDPFIDDLSRKEMNGLVALISCIRSRRTEFNVPPSTFLSLFIVGENRDEFSPLIPYEGIIKSLAKISDITFSDTPLDHLKGRIQFVLGALTLVIPLGEKIDLEAERKRLEKERDIVNKEWENIKNRLSNPNFLTKAKEEVILEFREKGNRLEETLQKINDALLRIV